MGCPKTRTAAAAVAEAAGRRLGNVAQRSLKLVVNELVTLGRRGGGDGRAICLHAGSGAPGARGSGAGPARCGYLGSDARGTRSGGATHTHTHTHTHTNTQHEDAHNMTTRDPPSTGLRREDPHLETHIIAQIDQLYA